MLKKLVELDQLPRFKVKLEDTASSGVSIVSIVDDPAIEVKGMYFNSQVHFDFKSVKDQMKIVGPAMIPDKDIYRKDEKGNEYFVTFDKDVILGLVRKFNSKSNNRSINVDHSKTMVDAFIEQNWIVEDEMYDKSKMYGFNCPVGTWFIEMKIEDEKFWKEQVKEGGRYSFSIEALLGLEYEQMMSSHIVKLTSGVPAHDNCKCEIIDNEWITDVDACDYCLELAAEHNSKSFSKVIDDLTDKEVIDILLSIKK